MSWAVMRTRCPALRTLMAVLHEAGHALYELGRPEPWQHQPVGEARGTSVHETQSLLIEMQAARTWEFIAFLAPLARDAFGGEGPAWTQLAPDLHEGGARAHSRRSG